MTYTPEQQKRIRELKNMTEEQWDAICKGCGMCCLCKLEYFKSTIFYTNLCCKHLDPSTQKCTIFERRFNTPGTSCAKVDLNVVLYSKCLPKTCGYIEYIFGPAKKPINVDWSSVRAVTPEESENFLLAVRHRIRHSNHWNHR